MESVYLYLRSFGLDWHRKVFGFGGGIQFELDSNLNWIAI
jgi:hypothetical protein